MGYLDNSTIVVDAVLTKEGRKRLSEGNGLDIGFFTLSDSGIDYRLWNPDHPSGSAFYGEAIENLPSLEAVPRADLYMRNKLITLNQNITGLPHFQIKPPGGEYTDVPGDIVLSNATDSEANGFIGVEVSFQLTNAQSLSNTLFIVHNQSLLADTPLSLVSPVNASLTNNATPSGQTYQSLVNTESVEASYHSISNIQGQSFFTLRFLRNVNGINGTTAVTIIDEASGIYKTFNLNVTGRTS